MFKDCETGPEMVVIPASSFKMGDLSGEGDSDEKPVHEVKIGYSFAVGKYEVTQAEWEAVRSKNRSEFKGRLRPVESIFWKDAKFFVTMLNEQTGKDYRLLSEAEWEYVARAGSTTKYPWGDEIDSSKAKYDAKDGSEKGTVPVVYTAQMPLECMTLQAMSGSGWKTATIRSTKTPQLMAVHG